MSSNIELYFAALNLSNRASRALMAEINFTSYPLPTDAISAAVELEPETKNLGKKQIDSCLKQGIDWITLGEQLYPESLRHTAEPPFVLFYRGNSETLNKDKTRLAIVGARNANTFGKETAYKIARHLVGRGACIVSGLALGIDAAAHRGSLVGRRPYSTIAVLAHGLDKVYPRTNRDLADQIIAENGTLLSQFPPGVNPLPHQFLIRNMVIAGISQNTLVIQAGERSGSLATARFALEAGREVCAIPGSISDPRHVGTNRLIREGAHLVTSPEEVASLLKGLNEDNNATDSASTLMLNEAAKSIISLLKSCEKAHYSRISEVVTNQSKLNKELLQLQLDGLVISCGSNHYRLKL